MWLLAILIPFPSQPLAQGLPGLDSTVAHIVDAPANTVWLVHPDMNLAHPKPVGVGYPAENEYALYTLSLGIVLGMQTNTQQETVDTNSALFEATTGKPLLSGAGFIFMAPPSVHAQMAYYESSRIAPVFLSGDETRLFWVTANGTVIQETTTSKTSLTASEDLFLLEVFLDPEGNYVFAGYGLTSTGTMAAATFYKAIFSQVSAYGKPWYIHRWVDANRNGIPDFEDNYTLVASEEEYPIPEFRSVIVPALLALVLVVSASRVRRIKEARSPQNRKQIL